jgi:hypothetical protein
VAVSRAASCAVMIAGLAACPQKGGVTPKRDAGDAGASAAGGGADGAGAEAGVTATPGSGTGRISVSVVWPTAPAAVRASPGYTACHTPRPARAQVGTLHGVTGAFVVVTDLPATAASDAKVRRLTVRDCAIEPAASEAGGASLEVQTQDVAHAVVVTRTGKPWLDDDGIIAPVELARARLPVLGHTITVALGEPGAIRVAADGADDDAAWVLAPPHRFAGVTDDTGALGLGDVPAGTHTVVAWLPPRAGQPAQRATGSVTVTDGAVADVKLTFAP